MPQIFDSNLPQGHRACEEVWPILSVLPREKRQHLHDDRINLR